ncbi:MAG: formate dehydrogenase accessory sulfurtransferase FdhD, partial [Bacteroidota bacterium]
MEETHPSLFAQVVTKFSRGGNTEQADQIAVEEPLDIRLSNGGPARSVAITMRTPGRDADLARGFLFSEGILGARTQVQCEETKSNVVTLRLAPQETIDWNHLQRHSYTTSSCGVCGKTSLDQVFQAIPFGTIPKQFTVSSSTLYGLPATLRANQELFAATGGIHAAG